MSNTDHAEGLVELPQSLNAFSSDARPCLAILIHGHGSALSVHEIEYESDGASRICPGRLATRADQAALGAIFRDEPDADTFLLPDNLLGIGAGHLTWFTKPQRRAMHLRIGEHEPRVLDVTWPALIFHARENTLYVKAWSGKGRPDGGTRLYHAPLWNLSASGELCAGGGRIPGDTSPASITAWESLVFDTSFTHVNHDLTLNRRHGASSEDLLDFWLGRDGKEKAPTVRVFNSGGDVRLGQWLVEGINEYE